MELGTGLTILGTALGGKDILIKMLGPTAEYIGDGLKDFAEKRVENVKNIFKNASDKLGNKIDNTGSIPPKVLRGTINEGSYTEDFLGIEYFGGVLASSRTGISRDDRGVFFNSLISRLSTYQLRMHYILYHAIKQIFNGENINIGIKTERKKLRIYIPVSSFIQSMDFTDEESDNISVYLDHIINGLLKDQIIDEYFMYGPKEGIKEDYSEASEDGLLLQPDRLGFELFYWAYGRGQENPNNFLNDDVIFELDKKVVIDNRIKRITTDNN